MNTTNGLPDRADPADPVDRVAIDWTEVRRRVEYARAYVAAEGDPGPEARRRVLKERSASLARPSEAERDEAALELVTFRVSRETYGIESRHVQEVYPLRELTPVPCTPPFVAGMVNVRGQILSVVDIRAFFDLPRQGISDLNRVVILKSQDMSFGILADAIVGPRRIAEGDLQASLPTLTEVREEYLKGVTADRLVVLDGAKILSDPRLVVHEDVGREARWRATPGT